MMRGFRKDYEKLAGQIFTTIRVRPHEDWESQLGRVDAIVLYARTQRAVTLGRAQIVGVTYHLYLSRVPREKADWWGWLTEEFARYDAEKSREDLIGDLEADARRMQREWVVVYTYLWTERQLGASS